MTLGKDRWKPPASRTHGRQNHQGAGKQRCQPGAPQHPVPRADLVAWPQQAAAVKGRSVCQHFLSSSSRETSQLVAVAVFQRRTLAPSGANQRHADSASKKQTSQSCYQLAPRF